MTNFLSEVTIRVSKTDDGKFKGHIFVGSEHIVTVPNKSRDTAIGHAVAEAKNVLKKDNISPSKVPA